MKREGTYIYKDIKYYINNISLYYYKIIDTVLDSHNT